MYVHIYGFKSSNQMFYLSYNILLICTFRIKRNEHTFLFHILITLTQKNASARWKKFRLQVM
jgi:hypothetical protein